MTFYGKPITHAWHRQWQNGCVGNSKSMHLHLHRKYIAIEKDVGAGFSQNGRTRHVNGRATGPSFNDISTKREGANTGRSATPTVEGT